MVHVILSRLQRVKDRASFSLPFVIRFSVLQISHLGHFSFLMYFDDVKMYFRFAKFLLLVVNTLLDMLSLKSDLARLEQCCRSNDVIINVDKYRYMSIFRKGCYSRYITFRCFVRLQDEFRSIKDIFGEGWKSLGFDSRHFHKFEDIATMKHLYEPLVKLYLEFASSVWCPCISQDSDWIGSVKIEFFLNISHRMGLFRLNLSALLYFGCQL